MDQSKASIPTEYIVPSVFVFEPPAPWSVIWRWMVATWGGFGILMVGGFCCAFSVTSESEILLIISLMSVIPISAFQQRAMSEPPRPRLLKW